MRFVGVVLVLTGCDMASDHRVDTAVVHDTSETDDTNDTDDTDDTDDTNDTDTHDTNVGCVLDPGPCPSNALAMGKAGAFHVQTVGLQWRYDSACGVYVADPVFLSRDASVVSYALTVDAGSAETAFGYLAADGQPLINALASSGRTALYNPPFKSGWSSANTVVLPNGPDTKPSGSCVAVVPIAESAPGGSLRIASRRYAAGSTVDLNFVVVDDTDIAGWELEHVVSYTRTYLAGAGVSVGDANLFSVDMGYDGYVDSSGPEIDALRAVGAGGSSQPLNVFIVQDFLDASIYGIAGGVPGPIGVHGTVASGVVVSVDTHLNGDLTALYTDEFGATVAHELGHQLGLFHTTEADGSDHDVLDDTPECPIGRDADGDGRLSAAECSGFGGDHVMFWTSSAQTQDKWSSRQSAVLTASPAARP